MAGLKIEIPRNGPGDGPKDSLAWTFSAVGPNVGGGTGPASIVAGVTDPDGRPVARMVRTDSTNSALYLNSTTKPSGFVLAAGGPWRARLWVKAAQACDVAWLVRKPTGGGTFPVNSLKVAPISSGQVNQWVGFNFSGTADSEAGSDCAFSFQCFAPGGSGSATQLAPSTYDVAITLYTP